MRISGAVPPSLMALAVIALPALAQQPQTTSGTDYEDFAQLTAGATAYTGFFDLYEKGDDLWLAVPPARLGEDFLMEMKVAQGIGADGIFGGTMLDIFEGKVMSLERHGDRVFMMQRPHRFNGGDDPAVQRAVDLTIGSSVVESAQIESIRDDGALVISVQDWFVSDLSNIGADVEDAAGGNASFNDDLSYVESVKSFPSNTNIRARLTFRSGSPQNIESVPDPRSISVSIHYTLAQLPTDPMTTRVGDDRVGNFMTVHKDFSSLDSTFFVRRVNRWRLEPAERVGDRWRPVEPITYYIDHTVPEAYRDLFKRGVEEWNAAFEAAGWEGAIRALDLPEDADAEDIRYATLRWNTSDDTGYGAIGPSIVDPRTGETLDADILFEANMFQGHRRSWRNLVGPVSAADALENALGIMPEGQPATNGTELAGFANAFVEQSALLGLSLMARGEMGPHDPVPQEFLDQATVWVVMHEVGHTLGLRHNFRSSASTPFERLHDRAWAEENGLYSSVMEYPTVNVAPPGQEQGYFYNPGVGSYDRWAITYAYSPDPERAAQVAREVADPRHLYGTNSESGGAGALDPSISTYDMSGDPLSWGIERSAIAAALWRELPDYALADNESYSYVTSAFQTLMREYSRGLAPAAKYIGGQYINRDHVGDPNGRMPFENVPVAEQRRALNSIIDRVFAADAFDVPQTVLQHLGANTWNHWGENSGFGDRLDFPFHEEIVDLQTSMINRLFDANRLARIRDAETKFGPENVVAIPELMDALTVAIWSELDGTGSITAMRRDLQRAHIDALAEMLVEPADGLPNDARAVARLQLRDLAERIDGRVTRAPAAPLDVYSRAHLDEAAARIAAALEASITLSAGAG